MPKVKDLICDKCANTHVAIPKGCPTCRLRYYINEHSNLHRLIAYIVCYKDPCSGHSVDECIDWIDQIVTRNKELTEEVILLRELIE